GAGAAAGAAVQAPHTPAAERRQPARAPQGRHQGGRQGGRRLVELCAQGGRQGYPAAVCAENAARRAVAADQKESRDQRERRRAEERAKVGRLPTAPGGNTRRLAGGG